MVYAGSFNPNGKGEPIGPDMTLEPAKAVFPALSNLAEKVRAASYVNGVLGACSGAYLYALELPDRSFVEGYLMGSRSQPGASAASAHASAAPAAATTAVPATVEGAAPAVQPAAPSL